jgi:5'-methylthioadenosine phosphorylase
MSRCSIAIGGDAIRVQGSGRAELPRRARNCLSRLFALVNAAVFQTLCCCLSSLFHFFRVFPLHIDSISQDGRRSQHVRRYATCAARPPSSPLTSLTAPVHIAVIGGTGISTLPGFTLAATLDVDTPWGKPSSPISILQHTDASTGQNVPVAFLSRHGLHHELAPHEVKNQANIAALRHIGVRTIIAFSAVGSLQEEVRPRDFVVPDQIIDRTKGIRPFTFFEKGMVGHVGFGDPFDKDLAKLVRKCGHSLEGEGVRLHDKGLLICMEGPQFSTRAESNLYRTWGGSVINMSALPEAKLAREAEISYQMICMATDYDCWRGDGSEDVNVEMVMAHMKANAENARRFVGAVLNELTKAEHEQLVLAKHMEGQMRFAGAMTKKEARGQEAEKKLQWLFPGYFD